MRAENIRATVESVACTDRDGWRRVKIGALGRVVTGKTPPTADEENFGGAYPFVTPGDMHQGRCVIVTARYVSDKGALTVKNSRIPKGAVCVSCIGSDMGNVVYTNRESFTNQQINSIICCGDVDSLFVYYLMLTQKDIIKGIGTAGGSAVPIMSKSEFCDLDVALPPFPVQRKIADILGAYDDLIENNRRRIALLEKMASELYRERFCRRKYIANKIAIGELIVENAKSKIKAGDCKGGVGNIPFFTSGSSIYWCNDGLVDGVNLYLNTGGSSDVKIHNGEASYSTDTWSISSDKDNIYFLFHYLKTLNDSGELFSSYFKGATIQHLQKRDFRKHVISVPEPNDLASFNALVIPMHLAADNFKKKNQRLCSARDRLLPRLMSGKIDLDKLVKGEEAENG